MSTVACSVLGRGLRITCRGDTSGGVAGPKTQSVNFPQT